ncbi:MAG: hypothetical protein LAO78_03350 [Acidobacteriia bacterium]|nr:hypothetical protein [Terriglobia bacterium]
MVSGFPSVCNLWQEFPDTLNVRLRPKVNAALAQFHYFRRGNLAAGNVSAQCNRADSELSCRFGGRDLHSGITVPDRYEHVKQFLALRRTPVGAQRHGTMRQKKRSRRMARRSWRRNAESARQQNHHAHSISQQPPDELEERNNKNNEDGYLKRIPLDPRKQIRGFELKHKFPFTKAADLLPFWPPRIFLTRTDLGALRLQMQHSKRDFTGFR